MRTLVIILCAVLLWALYISAGKLLTGHLGASMTHTTLIVLLPAALALVVRWRIL